MAETATQLTDVIHLYCQELQHMGIRCERVLLFGSQAKGTAHEGSDIDLIVISPDWDRYGKRERLELLGIAAARILEPVQAYGFTPEEITSHQTTAFWEQVLSEQTVHITGTPEKGSGTAGR
jgi:uncharacterized protein